MLLCESDAPLTIFTSYGVLMSAQDINSLIKFKYLFLFGTNTYYFSKASAQLLEEFYTKYAKHETSPVMNRKTGDGSITKRGSCLFFFADNRSSRLHFNESLRN